MERVKNYITKHTLRTKKKFSSVPNIQIPRPTQNNPSTTISTSTRISEKLKDGEANLPSNFTKLEAWQNYVKKTFGTHSFSEKTELEAEIRFIGSINKECYFCCLDNHTYDNCELLQEFKRLALVANDNNDNQTAMQVSVVDEDEDNTNDNNNNNNNNNNCVTTYVDYSINDVSSNYIIKSISKCSNKFPRLL